MADGVLSNTPLLHYFTTPLLHYSTTPLLQRLDTVDVYPPALPSPVGDPGGIAVMQLFDVYRFMDRIQPAVKSHLGPRLDGVANHV